MHRQTLKKGLFFLVPGILVLAGILRHAGCRGGTEPHLSQQPLPREGEAPAVLVHGPTGQILHPMTPEEMTAYRTREETARLRRIWSEIPGDTLVISLGLQDGVSWESLAETYPQMVRVREGDGVLHCKVPRLLAESFLDELPEGVTRISDAPEAKLFSATAVNSRFLGLAAPLRSLSPLLDGRGEIVAVIDTGLSTGQEKTMHPDLFPSLYGMVVEPSVSGASSLTPKDQNGHGTHVAGCIVSRGRYFALSEGSAPGAHLFVQRIHRRVGTTDYLEFAATNAPHFERSYAAGARIISCSWGHGSSSYGSTYAYDEDRAQSIDAFVWEHPETLICFAVGNHGTDRNSDGVIDGETVCSYEAYAKNALIVGAQESYQTDYYTREGLYIADTGKKPFCEDLMAKPYEGDVDGMAAFSSRGPLTDGRIAPMLVAPGTAIYSTATDSEGVHGVRALSGSSMATPLVAGSAAVLRQYLKTCHNLQSPTAAVLRAGLILCAETLAPGQYGEGLYREIPETSPNSVEGWGSLRLGHHLAGEATLGFVDRIPFENGSWSCVVTIPPEHEKSELAVVLSWIDAPGKDGGYPRTLINNYDLTVTDPEGVVHTLDDELNPIERILIPEAKAGDYTVCVKAAHIAEDGPGNIAALAWRAMTDSGPVALPGAGTPSEDSVTLTVLQPAAARAYLDFPLYPAPGEHVFPKGTDPVVRVLSGAKLNPSAFGIFSPLCGWVLRKADGSVQQGISSTFDLTVDQDMTLQWYTDFPGYRFLLR